MEVTMSMNEKNNQENEKDTKKHQNRGAQDLPEDAGADQFQGEYHEEGKPVVRGNTSPQEGDHAGATKTKMAHDGKGGLGQNNLGQHNDQDDDFQSGSKGGNRSGKSGSMQGGSRRTGTV